MRKQYAVISCWLVIVALLPLAGAQAQARPPDLVVVHTATSPQPQAGSLPLSIFFSLRDQNGDLIPKAAVTLATTGTLALSDAGGQPLPPAQVTISDPNTPIRVALVVDKSGSMNNTFGGGNNQPRPLIDAVREAAVQSIAAAPDQAEFAVFSFAQQTTLESGGFLRKRDQAQLIADTIVKFRTNPFNTGNTCLSDAANTAIDYLVANQQSPIERKAVILFTDGKDKEANGSPNNGNDCSNLDLAAIARKAQLSSTTIIPIYTIAPCLGDCGNIRRGDLEDLSRTTRAASAIDAPDKINDLFKRIMSLLNNQWVAQANVFARKGPNTATLTISMNGVPVPITGATSFESDRDYVAPPRIEVAQNRYDSAQDAFAVSLRITNPQQIGQIVAGVYDRADGGTLVSKTQEFAKPGGTLEFPLSPAGLIANTEYFLRLTATDPGGAPIRTPAGEPLVVVYPFTYKPQLTYEILSVDPLFDEEVLSIKVDARGTGGRPLTFKGFVTDKETGEREELAETPLKDGLLRPALPRMLRTARQPKTYTIMLSLQNGQEQMTRTIDRLIAPPQAESMLTVALRSPFVLYGVPLLLLLVGGLAAYETLRSRRREIPRPFNSPTIIKSSPKPAPDAKPSSKNVVPIPEPEQLTIASKPAPSSQQSAPAAQIPSASALTTLPTSAKTQIISDPPADATVVHQVLTEVAAPQPRPRVSVTVVRTVDASQQREETVALPCVIGRERADVNITGDPKISRAHAEITYTDGQFAIKDRESTNGTFIGETRLAKGDAAPLNERTTVRLGPNTVLEIEPKL